MAYRGEDFDRTTIYPNEDYRGLGLAADASTQVRAGSGACYKCGCTAFESGGANSYQCGNSSCAHAWEDHA